LSELVTSWSTQQLVEFLAAVSSLRDEEGATRIGVERAAEALEAEVGALVRDGEVVTSIGFPTGKTPADVLVQVAEGKRNGLELPGLGVLATAVVSVEEGSDDAIVLARSAEAFSADELNLLRGMARVLALTLRLLRFLDRERSLRAISERQATENANLLESLQERQTLLEKSAAIQRAITRRAPLQEVLDAITSAASELLGDEVVGLRLVDQDDPSSMVAAATNGVTPELRRLIERGRVGEGAGGRAIAEDRLVIIEDYEHDANAIPGFVEHGLQAAMAAPVHEKDAVVGSLTVASYRQGRTYGAAEQEMVLAFAEHASLALMDAKTVDAMVHQALHDSLTGLPNRALFLDRLEHSLARTSRDPEPVAVLFLDIDRFKTVNDSLGHAAGDEVLCAVAERLRSCVRASDTAARLGGDEFALLLEGAGDRSEAARLAERVIQRLELPFPLEEKEVVIGCSVGIAVGAGQSDDLLRNADVAMYRAKSEGRGRYEFFEPGMRAAVIERLELEGDLRRAIDRREFVLHYQPIISLATGEALALEALVRWQHPRRGLVPPLEFIPLAEETGAIVAIGRHVLGRACQDLSSWRKRFPGSATLVNVNLSARQLQQPGFIEDVRDALEAEQLQPSSLVLEITETVLMQDAEATVEKLQRLKSLGVRLAVDDFGTGYSSLRYLRDFPLDLIKIAKPFVDGIAAGRRESSLAQAIVDLGQLFELQVVAEGVEDEDQLARLRSMGCAFGQGFLFARPLPADELEALLGQEGPGLPLRVTEGSSKTISTSASSGSSR
jgi:diguanylate cyclase (GGDEF)-like protein